MNNYYKDIEKMVEMKKQEDKSKVETMGTIEVKEICTIIGCSGTAPNCWMYCDILRRLENRVAKEDRKDEE